MKYFQFKYFTVKIGGRDKRIKKTKEIKTK